MNKKIVIPVVLVAVIGVGAGVWYVLGQNDKQSETKTTETNVVKQPETKPEAKKDSKDMKKDAPKEADETTRANGRYTDYDASKISATGYDTTVLFFHAPWCPECQAFDNAIKNGQVPAGTQILKVDYDSNKDLRQKYGVTVQTTFVRVADNGDKQSLWTGYGNVSLEALLENIK